MKNTEPAFAIIRLDPPSLYQGPSGPASGVIQWLTVKEIVWTIEEAEEEVRRLNELNAGKGCVYFWQGTRVCRN